MERPRIRHIAINAQDRDAEAVDHVLAAQVDQDVPVDGYVHLIVRDDVVLRVRVAAIEADQDAAEWGSTA